MKQKTRKNFGREPVWNPITRNSEMYTEIQCSVKISLSSEQLVMETC